MFKTILNTNESLERLTLSAFDTSMLALIQFLISLMLLSSFFYEINWSTKSAKMMHMLHTDHDKEHHDPWHNMPHLLFSVCMFAGHFDVIK